jgi:xanthine dehydrogenase YagS FAD-binding subunit
VKSFKHLNAKTLAEAKTALAGGNAIVIAGGTDLIGTLKDNILPTYPATIVNIKTISPSLDYIKEEGGMLKIGAVTRLADIAASETVKKKYTALAQAASRVATPHVRDMGTIGGNIAQLHRCWYLRKPENRFDCTRKGGKTCYAMAGDSRYHSIFGVDGGCMAVHPSDVAPALIALDAKIVTTNKAYPAETFWKVGKPGNTVLAPGEIITEIQIPAPPAGAKSAFIKFAIRKSIDFPIVNCAVLAGGGSIKPRIALNAVAPTPYRAAKAEAAIAGKKIDEASAEAAGDAAIQDVKLIGTAMKFKVQIAKVMVKRALLATV